MRNMVEAGEADALVSERVWRELERALGEGAPQRCLEVLRDCGALEVLLPEIAKAGAIAAAVAALATAAARGASTPVRWAAMLAGLSVDSIEALCERLRVPNNYRELAVLAARLESKLREGPATDANDGRGASMATAAGAPDPEVLLELLELADAFRRPERFGQWLELLALELPATQALARNPGALAARLRTALSRAATVQLSAEDLRAHRGPKLGELLRAHRLEAVRAASAPT